jgi:hypothetical protein
MVGALCEPARLLRLDPAAVWFSMNREMGVDPVALTISHVDFHE